jgi:hypothetical protein
MIQLRHASVVLLLILALNSTAGEPPVTSQPKRVDLLGDALPAGALARLGTIRGRAATGWDIQSKLLADGKTLLIAKGEEIRRLDAELGRVLKVQQLPKDHSAVGFSDDGQLALIVTRKDYTIQTMSIWDVATAKETQSLPSTENLGTLIFDLFSPDAKIVLTNHGVNNGVGVIRAWDLANGSILWKAGKQQDMGFWDQGYSPLGFPSDGKTAVVQERAANRISVRDRMTGKEKRSFSTMSLNEARNLRLSPDGKSVFMGTSGPAVRVWEVESGRELPSLGGHKGQAHSCAISRDGQLIATGGQDPFIQIWDWPSGKLRRRIDFDQRRSGGGFAFSADGRQVQLVIFGESVVRSFNVDTGKEIPPPLESHRGTVYGVSFTPDNKLVSAGNDDTVRFWDSQTGKHLAMLRLQHPVGP